MHKPNRIIPKHAKPYGFLNKDTMVQLEEIRAVSKSRLDKFKLGDIDPDDFLRIKNKLKNVFEI